MTISITELKSDINTPYIQINFKGLNLMYWNIISITVHEEYKLIQILGTSNVFTDETYIEDISFDSDNDIKTVMSELKKTKMIEIEYT
jgi:hypothetical protein